MLGKVPWRANCYSGHLYQSAHALLSDCAIDAKSPCYWANSLLQQGGHAARAAATPTPLRCSGLAAAALLLTLRQNCKNTDRPGFYVRLSYLRAAHPAGAAAMSQRGSHLGGRDGKAGSSWVTTIQRHKFAFKARKEATRSITERLQATSSTCLYACPHLYTGANVTPTYSRGFESSCLQT